MAEGPVVFSPPPPDPSQTPLARLDREARVLREQLKAHARGREVKALRRQVTESFGWEADWVAPYRDFFDAGRADAWFSPLNSTWDRRHGHAYPMYWSEQQLAILRGMSRVIANTNPSAARLQTGVR